MAVTGIDVSSYQSSTYSTKGYDFAFVKATEGTSYVNPRMVAQAAHARAAGLVVGFYHFLRPGSMKAQAAYFVEKACSVPGDPLWADWEHAGVSSADKDEFIREVQWLRGDTHRVGLYCNTSYWTSRDKSSFAGDGLWIAVYNGRAGKPGIKADFLIHQWTSTPIDTNLAVAWKSRAEMRAWAMKAPAGKPKPESKPEPKPATWLKVEGFMPELHFGDESWHVGWLQRNLNRFRKVNLKETGKYDTATAKAVDEFYAAELKYKTTTGGKVFGADGWRRVLSVASDSKGSK